MEKKYPLTADVTRITKFVVLWFQAHMLLEAHTAHTHSSVSVPSL